MGAALPGVVRQPLETPIGNSHDTVSHQHVTPEANRHAEIVDVMRLDEHADLISMHGAPDAAAAGHTSGRPNQITQLH